MTIEVSELKYVATPAASSFVDLLGSGAMREAALVLDEHWLEIWYAMDPTDLKALLVAMPSEALAGLGGAEFINNLVGSEVAQGSPPHPEDERQESRIDRVAREVGDLRMAGKPEEALGLAMTVADEVQAIRGLLVDTTGGRAGMWLVQGGITALLAGDLPLARRSFRIASDTHRPDCFPFVRRDALVKLALVQAISGEPAEALALLARAEPLPRSESWVERLIDDSVWLTRYICAIDALELDQAEEMRVSDSSPFSQLEFWGVALLAQVRHLCLTGRRGQARALCDEVAAAGFPLPGSDGWLARMLADAYLQCTPLAEVTADELSAATPAKAALARRVHLLGTGQYGRLVVRDEAEGPDLPTRIRLGFDLVRGQGLLHSGQVEDGRRLVLSGIEEALLRGTPAVLRFLTHETLSAISDTGLGARARRLVDAHEISLMRVEPILSTPLTASEERTMRLLARGLTRNQIAAASYVSVDTVKTHLSSAYRKLGVRSRGDAIVAFEHLDP